MLKKLCVTMMLATIILLPARQVFAAATLQDAADALVAAAGDLTDAGNATAAEDTEQNEAYLDYDTACEYYTTWRMEHGDDAGIQASLDAALAALQAGDDEMILADVNTQLAEMYLQNASDWYWGDPHDYDKVVEYCTLDPVQSVAAQTGKCETHLCNASAHYYDAEQAADAALTAMGY